MRKYFVALIIFALIFPFLFQGSSVAASGLSSDPASKITPELLARLNAMQPGEVVTVIVTLRDQTNLSVLGLQNRPDRQQVVLQTVQARAHASQRAISAILDVRRDQGQVARVVPFWVFNGLSVTATKDTILELAARDDVASLAPDEIDLQPAAPLTAASAEPNLALINAPALWGLGYSGQGVVVANMDTGVDISHPELAARWRGGSNSWFDPYGQHPVTPVDISGHGTWTMGVMVAGDASGTSVGVAPQAQWIAVKIFNDSGAGTATAIHQGFQWLLDPDQNPSTADAPQVVNNSWSYGGPGCRLDFQNDLRTLRAAGILPVFAAGNYGPGAATSVSPGNYPEAFAVGGINNNNLIFSGSSRGPSACGEPATTYPELVAPAVSIKTTDRYGLYTTASGTSLSAPQVAGALALLLSAFPGLTADAQAAALLNSAVDLGAAGPDNSFGYGRLDVLGAYNWLAGGGQIPPTATLVPSATATSLPNPTLTPTSLPSATPTSLPSATATLVPSATATALPTSTATPLPSPTPTALSTSTSTALPSATPTSLPSATPPPQPSATPGSAILFGDGFEFRQPQRLVIRSYGWRTVKCISAGSPYRAPRDGRSHQQYKPDLCGG